MNKFEAERTHFAALRKWAYLDHATFGLVPQYALDAMVAYLTYRNTEGVDIGKYHEMWGDTDAFRGDIARMINCEADEVTFGQSSTQLFNIFTNGIGLKPGDNIVTTDCVYPANAYAWSCKADKGVTVRFAKTVDGAIAPQDLLALADERTRAVTLCMVENKTGWRHDVKTIGAMCRERGILLIVDVTQCANALMIDVKDMHIDFLTASGYKWLLSDQGFGFAYISKKLLETLDQSICGWVGTEDRWHNDAQNLRLSTAAKRYELGGINFAALFGMREVVARYLRLGPEDIQERVLSLVDHVYARARADLKKFRIPGDFSRDNRSGIVVFAAPSGVTVTDAMLAEKGIRARAMQGGVVRTGFHYMNTTADAGRLIEALAAFEK